MKNALLLLGFFIFAPIVFTTAFIFSLMLSYTTSKAIVDESSGFTVTSPVAYAALPSTSNDGITIETTASDAREEIVRQFLARYNSPLEPYAATIVTVAKTQGLDYRLIPAIAMQESNLCKKVRDDSAYNCWGWGIYSGKGKAFDSYEHGIQVVTEALSRKYKDNNGLVTPEEIEKLYNPNSEGSWSFSVKHFMSEME